MSQFPLSDKEYEARREERQQQERQRNIWFTEDYPEVSRLLRGLDRCHTDKRDCIIPSWQLRELSSELHKLVNIEITIPSDGDVARSG